MAANVNLVLRRQGERAKGVNDALVLSSPALRCVVNGPVGGSCALPEGGTLPTLAEALYRLNATSIGSIAAESFTASAAQTECTLAAAPAGAAYLEVALNGAHCANPTDYTLSGVTITFTAALVAGDLVDTRRYLLS
jgi:hypothetical protein